MKIFLTAAFIAGALLSGAALSDDKLSGMKGMDLTDKLGPDMGAGSGAAKRAAIHQTSGVVRGLDAGQLKATIAHGPVQSLNWPGMTMVFSVADQALFGKLKVGQKVNFKFEKRGSAYVIVAVN